MFSRKGEKSRAKSTGWGTTSHNRIKISLLFNALSRCEKSAYRQKYRHFEAVEMMCLTSRRDAASVDPRSSRMPPSLQEAAILLAEPDRVRFLWSFHGK